MKVLVVLGICVLVVLSGASEAGKDNQIVPGSMGNDKCASLKDRLDHIAQEIEKEIKQTREEIPAELQLQIKINAFSRAAGECIPNNRVYAHIHLALDDLHSIIADFPTPDNVAKKIKEAQNFLDENFDDLQAYQYEVGYNMSTELRSRIDKFLEENAEKAADIFESNRKKAKQSKTVFDDTHLVGLINKIVDKMDHCRGISPTDYKSVFNCHREVRSVGQELNRAKAGIRPMGAIRLLPPHKSIELLTLNFTAARKDLEWMVMTEKIEQKFLTEYKGHM